MISIAVALVLAIGAHAGFDPSFSTPVLAFENGMIYAGANRQASSWQPIADCTSASGDVTGVAVLSDGLLVTAEKEVRILAATNMTASSCGDVLYSASGASASLRGAWPSLDDTLIFVLDVGKDKVMMVDRSNNDQVTTEVRVRDEWSLEGLAVSEAQLFVSWRGKYAGDTGRSGFIARNSSNFGDEDPDAWTVEFAYGSSQEWRATTMSVDEIAEKGYFVEFRRDVDRMAVQSFDLPYYSGNLNSVLTGLDSYRDPTRAIAVDADSGYLWVTSNNSVLYAKTDGTTRGELDVRDVGVPVGVGFITTDTQFDYANAGTVMDDDGYLFDDDRFAPADDDAVVDDDAVDAAPSALATLQVSSIALLLVILAHAM